MNPKTHKELLEERGSISQIDFYQKDGHSFARIEMTNGDSVEFYVDDDARIHNYQVEFFIQRGFS